MALQLGALRDALLSAGADPQKADKAAEEAAIYDSQLTSFELRLTKIEGSLNLLKWMVATVVALILPALWLLLRVAAKIGALT